jgi:glycosyltransferase involved in cell wall biosynthesis
MKKTLVIELNISGEGHYLSFLECCLKFVVDNDLAPSYSFLVNSSGKAFVSPEFHSLITWASPVKDTTSLFRKSQSEWQQVKEFTLTADIQEIIFITIDAYQLAIALDFKIPFRVSGIQLRPHFRIKKKTGSLKENLKFKLWRLKKSLILRLFVINKSVKNIFLLNDKSAVAAFNKQYRSVFRYLPDPIFDYPTKIGFDIRSTFGIAQNQKILLVFGAIDERKNIPNLLKAAESLSNTKDIFLLIAGAKLANYQIPLQDLIKESESINPNLKIHWENRFVSNGEMEAFFQQSDVVWVVYKDFFTSSGIVGLAAKYKKPMIGSSYGLIGEIIRYNRFGTTVEPTDLKETSAYLAHIASSGKLLPIDSEKFVREHSPYSFSKILLSFQY